jgi:hypothetical protein
MAVLRFPFMIAHAGKTDIGIVISVEEDFIRFISSWLLPS